MSSKTGADCVATFLLAVRQASEEPGSRQTAQDFRHNFLASSEHRLEYQKWDGTEHYHHALLSLGHYHRSHFPLFPVPGNRTLPLFSRTDHSLSARTVLWPGGATTSLLHVHARPRSTFVSQNHERSFRCCFLFSRCVPPPPTVGTAERSRVPLTTVTEQTGGFIATRGFAAQRVCDAASGAPCAGRRVRRGAAERGVHGVACVWWVSEANRSPAREVFPRTCGRVVRLG